MNNANVLGASSEHKHASLENEKGKSLVEGEKFFTSHSRLLQKRKI